MNSSAEEWVNFPLIQKVWDTEAAAIDKYMTDVVEDSYVLDYACGPGFSADYVATKFGCHVLGVDIMPDMVAYATEHYGCEQVAFLAGDMCDVRLLEDRRGAFSWVMCHYGLHLENDVISFVESSNHALKEGGHFMLIELTRQFEDPLFIGAMHKTIQAPRWQEYRQKIEDTLQRPIFFLDPGQGHWIKDTDVLCRLIEKNGFKIKEKELNKKQFTVPLNKELVRAGFEAVKVLPENLQEEFVNDVVASARALGGPNPQVTHDTVLIIAQKTAEGGWVDFP